MIFIPEHWRRKRFVSLAFGTSIHINLAFMSSNESSIGTEDDMKSNQEFNWIEPFEKLSICCRWVHRSLSPHQKTWIDSCQIRLLPPI